VPPLVVHGFRNASDAEMRYLNFHAPGVGFADYMRGLRDGRSVTYDQEPPPAEGVHPPAEGVHPPSEAVIGQPGLGVHVGDGGALVDAGDGAGHLVPGAELHGSSWLVGVVTGAAAGSRPPSRSRSPARPG
jgi:hypothetical protein